MIQDIGPHRFDNAFKKKEPMASDYVLYYEENAMLVKKSGEGFVLPDLAEFPRKLWQQGEYLFSIDGAGFYLFSELSGIEEPFVLYPVQSMRDVKERWMGFAGVTGWQLSRWESSHRFCSRCGNRMAPSTQERALVCPVCGWTEYPRISPAVIVAVSDGDRLLMIRGKKSASGHYHLVAGYVEIGETFEQAVAREVYEEVGIRVKNIRYYKSQPWSFSDTIMVGFTAELTGADALTLQESEIGEAGWVPRTEIPESTSTASIGSELINNFRERT